MFLSNSLLHQLDRLHEVPLHYEDEETRVLAESVVPIEKLQARVTTQGAPRELERDLLLIELVQWFKRDFFRWINKPECDACNGKSEIEAIVGEGNTGPTPDETEGLAERIELYKCLRCSKKLRFP
ncbi:peptide-N(4)-(N-acetyl-beta-glucosaminyl)asparagine amidase-like, partial [Tropilaelaps mercedesae]